MICCDARFVGNYDELDECSFENAALYLSGGVHDAYSTEEILELSSSSSFVSNRKDLVVCNETPSVDELFRIVQIALQKSDMCACLLENVFIKA